MMSSFRNLELTHRFLINILVFQIFKKKFKTNLITIFFNSPNIMLFAIRTFKTFKFKINVFKYAKTKKT